MPVFCFFSTRISKLYLNGAVQRLLTVQNCLLSFKLVMQSGDPNTIFLENRTQFSQSLVHFIQKDHFEMKCFICLVRIEPLAICLQNEMNMNFRKLSCLMILHNNVENILEKHN